MKPRITHPRLLLGAILLCPSISLAQQDAASTLTSTSTPSENDVIYSKINELDAQLDAEVITIVGRRRNRSTAASSIVASRDLLLRALSRPADILEVTPGLKVVQHAGGGKANQYFIRGFDIDHGTDLVLTVDGLPVNMVSHGHGQGYADIHFVIPELVESLEVKKGPYFAEVGDFGTAGALNLKLKSELDTNAVSVVTGMFDTYRALVSVSPNLGNASNVFAGEVYTSNGPFDNEEDLQRYNIFLRSVFEVGKGELAFTLAGYGADWFASGQIPDREVAAGRLDRFGFIDPLEGGNSERFSASANYAQSSDSSSLSITAYFIRYELQLFSNFTFFSRDAENGDMIEQTDERFIIGGQAEYAFDWNIGDVQLTTTMGLQTRTDLIENGLFNSPGRERRETVIEAEVDEISLSAYAKTNIQFAPWLRTELGVRGDYFNFAARTADLDDSQGDGIVSPKVSIIASPWRGTEIFAKFGFGFHSNDARGVVQPIDPVEPLTRAIGGDVGFRTRLFNRLDLGVTGFLLDLNSEIVFIGDEGTTEASGATRRLGIEADTRLQVLDWLYFDADFTWTEARFVDAPDGEDEIPLAPRLTTSVGASVVHPDGYFGRASLFYIGERPATEDNFVRTREYTKLDATLGYRTRVFEISLTMFNLLDADVREAQFATTSRLPGETSEASCPRGTRGVSEDGQFVGCEDLHFTPGLPISVRGQFTVFF